jgi:Family of unknown function (DUF6090)
MAKLFNTIRKKLVSEKPSTNRTINYLKYAIGEIVLVVIGILIALQINNNNDLRKEHAKEIHYLQNIKTDLQLNIAELNKFLEIRKNLIVSAKTVIEHFEGKPVTDLASFNALCIPIYSWNKFYQSNNTYQELTNSGNLALIKNDSIKNILLNIEMTYKKLKSEETHYRYDMETTIYKPIYKLMDVQALTDNFGYRVSNGKIGKNVSLSKKQFATFFNNIEIKNGFTFTVLEYEIMNAQMKEMIAMSKNLIRIIDSELKQ